jgi:ABC-type Mn2+/Zn2+ transport system ATPase subunit
MIEVKNLYFFRDKQQIFTNFSMTLHPSETVLLTGPNGVGKSTLIGLIGGILRPDRGDIIIDHQDIARLNAKRQSRLRSVAPQRRDFQLAFTVEEIINFVPHRMREDYLEFIIDTLRLSAILGKKVTELSIGQQERVSLALALHQRAPYYLLDEPFSAQDSQATADILTVINFLKSNKKGVLVISHNQDALIKNFDRQVTLALPSADLQAFS